VTCCPNSEPASLSYLAFEGATKKNKPAVNPGDVVYAKLLVASRDMEAELVCVDSYGKKAGLGVLTGAGGFMFTVPLRTVRQVVVFRKTQSSLPAGLKCFSSTGVRQCCSVRPWRPVVTVLLRIKNQCTGMLWFLRYV
jgi:hypothetical protein